MFKHKQNGHPDAEIKMEVTRKFKDPLTRVANEGVRIKNQKPVKLLNSKIKSHQPSLVRLQIEKKNGNRPRVWQFKVSQ